MAGKPQSLLFEFWYFIREEKKYWIAPILAILVGSGVFLYYVEISALAPFLYPLF